MKTSKQVNSAQLKVPKNHSKLETYKLIEEAGFVSFPYSGFPLFLPIGQLLINRIKDLIKIESEKEGFLEVYLPLVQHRRYLEVSGRADLFKEEFMRLSGKREDYLLTPTNEEVLLEFARNNLQSYRQLPIKLFQIADKFRDIVKPKGLLRSREFLMADMCSIDADESSLRESASSFERVAESFFKRLGLKYYRLEKNDGKYVDFVIPCEEGETYISIDGQDNARFSSEEERANAITASSVGMYFIFEHFNEQAITYLSRLGKREPVQLGTYGFGLQRCLHALVHQTRDALGIKFSDQVRPFDASIIPVNSLDPTQLKQADRVYQAMQSRLKKPLLDDRKDNIKTRAEYADFIGCPYKVFIGPSEMKEGVLNIKRRGELNSRIMKLEEFLNEI